VTGETKFIINMRSRELSVCRRIENSRRFCSYATVIVS